MALRPGMIYKGDAFKLLKRVTPNSVQLCITDPPYCTSRANNLHTMGRTGINFSWDQEFDQVGWLKAMVDTLIPGAAAVIFNDWKNLGIISEALRILGMAVKRPLHFYKKNPVPRNKDRCIIQRMEYAVYAVKPGAPWIFNPGCSPTKLQKCCKSYLEAGDKYCGRCGLRVAPKGYEDGIFYHSVQRDPWHDTKKPNGLWEDIIKMFTNKGDTVLDPFAGVGTLAVAATRTERKHISIELDWLYVMWGNYQLRKEQEKLAKI